MLSLNQLKSILGFSITDLILNGVSVREALEVGLDEKSVHLNKSQWSKDGNCVILTGGSGSGKGWVKDNLIAADFQQVFDVDAMKMMYNNLVKSGTIDDEHGPYNFSNPEEVSDLHVKVKGKGWDKSKDTLMLTNFTGSKSLPNILFDITGRELNKVTDIGKRAQDLGYNVVLIWVCTPREVAIIGNLSRDRKVLQSVFHSVHNAVKSTMLKFIEGHAKDFDEVFLVLNPGKNITQLPNDIQEIAKRHSIVQLTNKGSYFDLPNDLKNDIIKFLGKDDDPDNPKVYKDFKDIDVKQGVSGVYR